MLKVFGTALAITWLAHTLETAGLAAALGRLRPAGVLLALLLTLLSTLVAAWRWKRVLDYLGTPLSFWRLLAECLIASSYNLLLPSAVGGDAVRAFRLGRHLSEPGRAYASVVFERVLGFAGLALFAGVGLLPAVSGRERFGNVLAVVGALLVATLLTAPWALRQVARLLGRSERAWLKSLRALGEALSGPLARTRPVAETLSWSLLFQIVSLSILTGSGLLPLQSPVALGIYFGVPLALIVASLPVSVGGHGVRESMFVVVLGVFGVQPNDAFALSMLWLASNIFVASLGLAVLIGQRAWQTTTG